MQATKYSVLAIEDNAEVASLLSYNLEMEGYEVHTASKGQCGIDLAEQNGFELAILDLSLPDVNGLDLIPKLRELHPGIGIVILTSSSDVWTLATCLNSGADDFISKPFSVIELMARAKSVIRRATSRTTANNPLVPDDVQITKFGDLTVHHQAGWARRAGSDLCLSAREYELLCYLASRPGAIVTREELLDAIWGEGVGTYEHNVNSYINRLRAKLEPDPRRPTYIKTVWGTGYRFLPEQA